MKFEIGLIIAALINLAVAIGLLIFVLLRHEAGSLCYQGHATCVPQLPYACLVIRLDNGASHDE